MEKPKTDTAIQREKDSQFSQDNFLIFNKGKGLVEVSSFVDLHQARGQLILQANKQLLDEICTLMEEQREPKDWVKMQDRIKTCLWQLISFYGQKRRNQLNTVSHGINTRFRKMAWMTARVLFPGLLSWANDPQYRNTRPYKTIERVLGKEGVSRITPSHIAAYIIRKNIENSGKRYTIFTKKPFSFVNKYSGACI